MVDVSTLERFLADPRSTRARVDGRLVVPDALAEDGVRVEHVGDPAWAEARGFVLHVWRDVWIGVVAVEELTDLEVCAPPRPGLVTADAWRAWAPPAGGES